MTKSDEDDQYDDYDDDDDDFDPCPKTCPGGKKNQNISWEHGT